MYILYVSVAGGRAPAGEQTRAAGARAPPSGTAYVPHVRVEPRTLLATAARSLRQPALHFSPYLSSHVHY